MPMMEDQSSSYSSQTLPPPSSTPQPPSQFPTSSDKTHPPPPPGYQASGYQPPQQQGPGQSPYGGAGRVDANKKPNLPNMNNSGQQLWQRMKQAPGAGAVKFNIPKRPYVMANQTFPLGDQPPGQTLPNMTATTAAASAVATATVSAGNAQARLKAKQSRWETVGQRSQDNAVGRGGATRGRVGARLGNYRNVFSQRSPSSSSFRSSQSSSQSPSPHSRNRDRSHHNRRYCRLTDMLYHNTSSI
ncbi:leukocyte receptor cluster member 8-like protein [Triplophysa rosa]|uniref:Leukocyte receptor cluster member 8-like protein n=1 Tax=Triplophysa rosa TaxID=992332 RepID=A0A9W7WXM0_TRIRA|nr:leukocyte receptor cluster member 8-like protein [Triplophysa rosa]